jgi:hypothetical protein
MDTIESASGSESTTSAMTAVEADEARGLYELTPDRWFSRLSTDFTNRARRVTYGALGFAFSRAWRPRRLVLLSHMRAGSSLLTQLIANNEAVDGYGELHLTYKEPRHLWGLNGKVIWVRKLARPRSAIVIDKILHDHLFSPHDLRRMNDVETMFLVREPAETLPSLVASFGLSQTDALDYFVLRLRTLANFAESKPCGAAIALTYDDVINRTDASFSLVEHQLGLPTPLEDRYEPTHRGGDPSTNIRAGRILRGRKLVRHVAPIDATVLDRGRCAYDDTWAVLASRCVTLEHS